jgi:transposase InsO family protein
VEQARTWAQQFVQWYKHQHKHSGLKFVTPAQRHADHAQAILRHREQVYEAARQRLVFLGGDGLALFASHAVKN